MTRSFWFTLSTLSVCYGSEISINHSETLKPGLIFTHLNTTPDTTFSRSLSLVFLTVFLSFSHTLFLSLKIQILRSLGVNGQLLQRERMYSAWFAIGLQQWCCLALFGSSREVFSLFPVRLNWTLRAAGACLPAGAVIWLTDAKH